MPALVQTGRVELRRAASEELAYRINQNTSCQVGYSHYAIYESALSTTRIAAHWAALQVPGSAIKTLAGVPIANVKTIMGVPIADVKTVEDVPTGI